MLSIGAFASFHPTFGEPAACGFAGALTPTDPLGVVAKGLCETARARSLPKMGQD